MRVSNVVLSLFNGVSESRMTSFVNIINFKSDSLNTPQVTRALHVASLLHMDKKCQYGSDHVSHCIGVANIVSHYTNETDIICSALLHDTIRDTFITREWLQLLFNDDVANLVERCTYISEKCDMHATKDVFNITLLNENDWRSIIITISDRLHHMRIMQYCDWCTQRKERDKILQTLQVHTNLAHMIGAYSIQNELGERSLEILYPRFFVQTQIQIENAKIDAHMLDIIIDNIDDILRSWRIDAHITYRTKSLFSTFQKMRKYRVMHVHNISDINAVRIITKNNDISECYHILADIHAKWKVYPKSFKDYIAWPKMNGYQSLHTTITSYDDSFCVEIQIRTSGMHDIAEHGGAAHWRYKMSDRFVC